MRQDFVELPTNIPEKHLEICREIGRLAKQLGLTALSGSYDPAWGDGWHSRINFNWTQGRHGADSDMIAVSSEQHHHTKIKA